MRQSLAKDCIWFWKILTNFCNNPGFNLVIILWFSLKNDNSDLKMKTLKFFEIQPKYGFLINNDGFLIACGQPRQIHVFVFRLHFVLGTFLSFFDEAILTACINCSTCPCSFLQTGMITRCPVTPCAHFFLDPSFFFINSCKKSRFSFFLNVVLHCLGE